MNRFQSLVSVVGLPEAWVPYARLAFVDPSGAAGADADIELVEADSDARHIVVTVSEWQQAGGEVERQKIGKLTFDAVSGELIGGDDGAGGSFTRIAAAMAGMKVLAAGG
ncbi:MULTISPECIES: hypothetical protein [Burkholderia cepacia complex]|uniref:hypothetical protein n=1 Tax=Burkholderia cepacia complex TaxID=87882 RepID=UPI0011B1F3CA|nr:MULTISPECIES: hypothetical protein [Burkholderia cepacia complex]MBR8205294.1 hypothetical protein [Burkholderia vietnamiensis]HDR9134001.1 hypothetical protein [Burkholderia vietnamiensis]